MIKEFQFKVGLELYAFQLRLACRCQMTNFTIIIIIAIIRPQIGKNLDGQNVFIVFAALTHMSSVRRVVHRYCPCRHCVS